MVNEKSPGRAAGAVRPPPVVLDATAVATAWALAHLLAPAPPGGFGLRASAGILAITCLTLAIASLLDLDSAGPSGASSIVRSAGMAGLSVAAALVVGAAILADLAPARHVAGALLTLVLLCGQHWALRRWLDSGLRGEQTSRVVVVGHGPAATELVAELRRHRQLGLEPAALVGESPPGAASASSPVPWLGDTTQTLTAVARTAASSVIITAGTLPAAELNQLVRQLHHAGIGVRLSSGLTGIGRRQLHSLPLAHEPLLYVEANTPSMAERASRAMRTLASAPALATGERVGRRRPSPSPVPVPVPTPTPIAVEALALSETGL